MNVRSATAPPRSRPTATAGRTVITSPTARWPGLLPSEPTSGPTEPSQMVLNGQWGVDEQPEVTGGRRTRESPDRRDRTPSSTRRSCAHQASRTTTSTRSRAVHRRARVAGVERGVPHRGTCHRFTSRILRRCGVVPRRVRRRPATCAARRPPRASPPVAVTPQAQLGQHHRDLGNDATQRSHAEHQWCAHSRIGLQPVVGPPGEAVEDGGHADSDWDPTGEYEMEQLADDLFATATASTTTASRWSTVRRWVA